MSVVLATTILLAGSVRADRDPRFGVVCPWSEIGQTGVLWNRCGGGATGLGDWPRTEKQDDVYDWTEAESELLGFHQAEGLIPAPIISYTPKWAADTPEGAEPNVHYPPRDYAEYAEICAQYAFRFRGRVPTWEVWNEPNIGFFRGTIPQYAELLKVGSIGISQGDPTARVVFGGTAGVDTWFIRRCYEYGAGPYFDIIAVHPYQWGKIFDDRWFLEKLQRLRTLLDELGDSEKTIWLNEFGWRSGESPQSEAMQARLLVQCYVTALSLPHLGITKAFWFVVKDWGAPGYGLYRTDGSKKPAWYAMRTMTRQLAHRPYLGQRETRDARIYAFGTCPQADDNVLVVWASGLEPVSVILPTGHRQAKAFDIIGNELPIEIDNGGLRLEARPEPTYLHLPSQVVSELITPVPIRSFPDPTELQARPLVAATVYPQDGTARPFLMRGTRTKLRVHIFNGTTDDGEANLQFLLGDGLDRATLKVTAASSKMTEATVSLRAPPEAGTGLVSLHISGEIAGKKLPDCRLPVRIADGPVVEFYANSWLESSHYYAGGQSGCAESIRFGNDWSYKLPVCKPGRARIAMQVGAHQAQPWSVQWSQDNESWQPLYSGQSHLAWHTVETPPLSDGELYLKMAGNDQQVREVVVTFGL